MTDDEWNAIFAKPERKTMQVISVGFGKENFSRSSISLSAFSVKAPFLRETVATAHKRQGQVQRFPASETPDINGWLYLDTVQVPEGALILLQSSYRYNGSPFRDGAILLRIRPDAPNYLIRASLPASLESSQTGKFLVFQGRADIVATEEYSEYGLYPNQNWFQGFTNPEEVSEAFEIEMADAGTPKPVMETVIDVEGKALVTSAAPRRRFRK
jgi:hypothetical protein